MRITVLLIVGALACRAEAARQPSADGGTGRRGSPSLVGVWRVVRFCEDDSTGRLTEPMGPTPAGVFVYSPSGALSIQVMESPPPPPFVAGDDHPTDAERARLLGAYFGYFGTYTVTSESTVVHHVRGGTFPSYTGTDQHRVYRIWGDSLTIGGTRATWECRRLVRVE